MWLGLVHFSLVLRMNELHQGKEGMDWVIIHGRMKRDRRTGYAGKTERAEIRVRIERVERMEKQGRAGQGVW